MAAELGNNICQIIYSDFIGKENNFKKERKLKKVLLIIFTIISVLIFIFGLFHIPILSSLGVEFPERNFLWGLSIIPTVIASAIPLIICVCLWVVSKINNENNTINNKNNAINNKDNTISNKDNKK